MVLDTQVFNNQADTWEINEIKVCIARLLAIHPTQHLKVALVDENTLMPKMSEYYAAGGSTFLDMEITSFTDVFLTVRLVAFVV